MTYNSRKCASFEDMKPIGEKMKYVGQLNLETVRTNEIAEFAKIADSGDEVRAETDKAFQMLYTFDNKLHWIAKSNARLGHDRSLWVKSWVYDKEFSP